MNTPYQHSIFNQLQNNQQRIQEQSNFLYLEDIFYASVYSPHQDNPFYQEEQPHFVNPFQESPAQREITPVQPLTDTPNESAKPIFKSSYTKNACYNMCQKTIKVIKKGLFEDKLVEICQNNDADLEQFKTQIVKKKKDFTGPKALSSYLQKNTKETRVFAQFMRWFLTQKYLRMAINEGEMKDLKVYIQFKNVSLLPLLQ